MKKLNELYCEMISYYRNDPKRIAHFTKVHSYAKLIGELEQLGEEELFTLETAAFVHDIGIKAAEEKAIRQAYDKIFKTESGRRICLEMFGIEEA